MIPVKAAHPEPYPKPSIQKLCLAKVVRRVRIVLRESEWGGNRHAAIPGEGCAIRALNEFLTASPNGSFSKDQKASQHWRRRGKS